MKPKKEYKVLPKLPPKLEVLRQLAGNVLFSWQDQIRDLFMRIDPGLWAQTGHNPMLMLGSVSQERLEELAQDSRFLAQVDEVVQDFDRYMSPTQPTEFGDESKKFLAAYFSMEFGLAACLPIYSGGLGILAGDHLKSASDLNLPLVAVGLLYQQGYFSQYLTADGWQMETYPANDFDNLPIKRVRNKKDEPVTVTVNFREQEVKLYIWRVDVGRVPLFLLDTNHPDNPDDIRSTTAQLYGGDREMRLRQEIVLGIGGVRALKAMDIEPSVVHMNEGHSVFSALERINRFRKEKGLSFDAAREIVQASTVFTTHTPVPAGNDVFDQGLFRSYFEEYAKELGINIKVLMGYGRINPRDENEPFGVTPLALRLAAHANGVSRLHGKISRDMWKDIWPHQPTEDVPIEPLTNGIHVPTWISREMSYIFNRYLGPYWAEDPDSEHLWEQANQIPTTELWRAHVRCREQLVAFTRRRLALQLESRGISTSEIRRAMEVLNPDALTIGFARRFATYKRATLVFRDPDRLDKLLNDPERPVQIILAGKAHPQDNEGKEFIKAMFHLARQERFRNKIVFLEDYNIHIAHMLVSGSDIWLNTPRRPLEACGTSGMKALANGVINLSVLDGWWDEGYSRHYGWAIGQGEEYTDHELQDETESRDLYNLLEKEVVPLFYQRGSDDIPRGWVDMMRAGLKDLVPVFNAHRMVQEYGRRYYVPCTERYWNLSADDMSGAKDLAEWRRRLMTNWQSVVVESVVSGGGREIEVGEKIGVSAQVRLGELTPEDVTVEAYFGPLDHHGDFAGRETVILNLFGSQEGLYEFRGRIPCTQTGRFGFTVRVTPSQKKLENPFTMGLVKWS